MANLATAAQAALAPKQTDLEVAINNGHLYAKNKYIGSQIIRRSVRTYKGVYDFAIQGGAIGSVNLYDPVISAKNPLDPLLVPKPLVLPPNFIICRVLVDVITAITSGGSATVALSSGLSAADILAATAKASLGIGLVDGIPVNTAATALKIPATDTNGIIPQATVAVAALTAGKFNVHFEGYLSD